MELIKETRKICVQERTKSILFWISNVLLTYGIGALTLFEQYLSFFEQILSLPTQIITIGTSARLSLPDTISNRNIGMQKGNGLSVHVPIMKKLMPA